jgi:cupin 2 domain-containing protein
MLTNLFAEIPGSLPAEITDLLLAATNVRIERIVSHGQASPADFWFDQDEHEWVLLVRGAARLILRSENDIEEPVELRPGDFINIPAHQRHRVAWTTPDEPTIWLAVFYGGTMQPGRPL